VRNAACLLGAITDGPIKSYASNPDKAQNLAQAPASGTSLIQSITPHAMGAMGAW
jgi:hypothetical protein